jgi:hypothetical protein
MDPKVRQIIKNSILKSKKQKKEFLLFSRITIYMQDPIVSDVVEFDTIIKTLEKYIPHHLFDNIDVIYIGQYQQLIERGLEALYENGAIYITNTLSENIDYIENIIHENAHSLEETHGLLIYGDGNIQREFVGKRERLFHIIKGQGHDIEGLKCLDPEYSQEMDDFLYKELGYDKLNYLINGIFLNPYAVTSIREYFASGLEKYLLDNTKREQLRNFSPELTKKIEELINGY